VQNTCISIEEQLRAIQINACSPYNDGYVQSGCKKELVMLKHIIGKLIKRCPDFGDLEDEWEREIMFEILKYSK
jgi:hypothetical protein